MMKLTVLVDNNTLIDQYYLGEPGVCYYIEDGDTTLLFDVGYSDIFIQNAKAMGIDLSAVSAIAISHGHNDHTRGLQFLSGCVDLSKVKLIAHPETFKRKIYDNEDIGSPLSEQRLKSLFALTLTKTPLKISDHLTFLGEIPEFHEFEKRRPLGSVLEDKSRRDDFVLDDSALVYRGRNGLFIITGCSHSGICNIVEYAKRVCDDNRVAGIIGGFHLKEVSVRLAKTIDYFKQNRIASLYPCHCVSFAAKAEINKFMPIHEVGVGMKLEIE